MENEKIVRTVICTGQQPTEAQIREIERATSMPIVPNEDAPELTLKQYAEMATFTVTSCKKFKHCHGKGLD